LRLCVQYLALPVETQIEPPTTGIARVGVITDTHIPDRIKSLPPRVFELFSGVDLILHAGDICAPRVIKELEQVAPVLAVQGNRDIFYKIHRRLPMQRLIQIGNMRIGLAHGHGGLRGYLREKVAYLTIGYYFSQYDLRVQRWFKDAQAIVFGHTHYPVNRFRNGTLLFNPGAVGPDYKARFGASVGILTVNTLTQSVSGEIIPLSLP
jgi:uncharacterized protein